MTSQLPRQLGSSYELVELIARGGMGEVYLARDLRNSGRHVVLKSLQTNATRDAVGMFLAEARVATLLDHPNIVRVYEADYIDGRFVMAMERLHGCDLHELSRDATATGQLLPLATVVRLIRDACRGLEAAHNAKTEDGRALHLVHRDINPPNLFVTNTGVLKILDFGLAKSAVHLTRTRTGVVKGKWGYLSPEQCRGTAVDRRSDIFSLGIVLHELLSGQRLFAATHADAAMFAITTGFIPPPSRSGESLSEELVAVTMRALHREPSLRYPSAELFGLELDAAAAILGESDTSAIASHVKGHLAAPDAIQPEAIATWASEVTAHLELVSEHGAKHRRSPRWRMMTIAAAGALAVAYFAGDRSAPAERHESAQQSVPAEQPVPAQQPVQTAAVVETSAPPAHELPPALPRVPEPSLPAPSPRPPAPKPPRQTRVEPPAAIPDGRITLDARPSADVYVAGRFIGTTPLVSHVLPAGETKVRLVNSDLGVDRVISLTVPAGKEVRKVVQLNEP